MLQLNEEAWGNKESLPPLITCIGTENTITTTLRELHTSPEPTHLIDR